MSIHTIMDGSLETETIVLEEVETGSGLAANLVVYNDDVNTFDWVIECLMEVLGHTSEQSEQLSLLIHFKGKATVMSGTKDILRPKKEQLVDRGLSAIIEEFATD